MRRAFTIGSLSTSGVLVLYLTVADTVVTCAAFLAPVTGFVAVIGAIGYVVARKDSSDS